MVRIVFNPHFYIKIDEKAMILIIGWEGRRRGRTVFLTWRDSSGFLVSRFLAALETRGLGELGLFIVPGFWVPGSLETSGLA
ncbi:MAG: hypothetical protein H6560_15010 [Lewinellaceae bacterium]|nr:hypothetical protein [Lewinellaceae bacterium]